MTNCNKFNVIIFGILSWISLSSSVPSLNVPDEYVFHVEVDDEEKSLHPLIIECTGSKPLTWTTHISPEYYNANYNQISTNSYKSTFEIQDPYPADTGYLNCNYSSGESVSTYVYIDDRNSAFVLPSDQVHRVEVVRGFPIYLDCRTLNPDIQVEVYKNDKKFPLVDFDPRSGVVLNMTKSYAGSTLTCKNNLYPERSLNFIIQNDPNRKLPPPTIVKQYNAHFIIGEPFKLNCSIPIREKDDPKFSWLTPNQETDMDLPPTQKLFKTTGSMVAVNTLTVSNPTLSDSGMYKCIVSQGNIGVSANTTISVKRSLDSFVKFKTEKFYHLFGIGGGILKWIKYFKAYPGPLKHEFYGPLGRITESENVTIDYNFDKGKLSLFLRNLTAYNFGNYTAVLRTLDGKKDETTGFLIVNATPIVRFEEPVSVFNIDEDVTLRARILSYVAGKPEPNVTWRFYPHCPQGIGSCDLANETQMKHTMTRAFDNRFDSVVSFRLKRSGLVHCDVHNDFGNASATMDVVLSDKNHEVFFITAAIMGRGETITLKTQQVNVTSEISLIEGDNATIECFGLDFVYKDLLFSPDDNISNFSSSLSSGLRLNLGTAGKEMEGTYRCFAVNRMTKKTESVAFELAILEQCSPSLTNESNVAEGEGTAISVELLKAFNISCFVTGSPMPRITWFKDGQNIEEIPDMVDNKGRGFFLHNDSQILEFKFAQSDHEGKYTCKARNRGGSISPFATVTVVGPGLSISHWILIGAAVSFIILLIILVLFLIGRVKEEGQLNKELQKIRKDLFNEGKLDKLNPLIPIDEQGDLLPYDGSYEVDKSKIHFGKMLGSGAFGRVMQADVDGLKAPGKSTRVAVKMIKDGTDMAQLRALTLELKIMQHLGKHLNIVNLMGANTSTLERGNLWILVEYCRFGNLLTFMQRYKTRFVNQIDPVTGELDRNRVTAFPNDPLSPNSTSKSSRRGNSQKYDSSSGYTTTSPYPGSSTKMGYSRSNSNSSFSGASSSGVSRPGLYVGNPDYAPIAEIPPSSPQQSQQEAVPAPVISRQESQYMNIRPLSHESKKNESFISSSCSEGVPHTEVMDVSSPTPFSPRSSTSGYFSFDVKAKQASQNDGVPGLAIPFTTAELICWAWQVAKGMEYLSMRKVMHGDLAARNLLLAANNVVKISDFGLSRDIYKNDVYMKKGDEIMPIKWMAPEAIREKIFSIQSDVWAFGITMWELFTLGNAPYPGVPLDLAFPVALEEGMRMEKPKYSNDQLYSIIQDCWDIDPEERPDFITIAAMLKELLCPEKEENYVSMNTVYAEENEKWKQKHQDYIQLVSSPEFRVVQPHLEDDEETEMNRIDPSYIRMGTLEEEEEVVEELPAQSGYMAMGVFKGPVDESDTVFSPRPSAGEKEAFTNSVFDFDDGKQNKTSESSHSKEDEEEPKKPLSSASATSASTTTSATVDPQIPLASKTSNNGPEESSYQNLNNFAKKENPIDDRDTKGAKTSGDVTNGIKTGIDVSDGRKIDADLTNNDDVFEEGDDLIDFNTGHEDSKEANYMNLSKTKDNYVNTSSVV